MSYQQRPEPKPRVIVVKQRVEREPRERVERFSIEPLVVPALIAGGLIFYAVYKDRFTEIINKLFEAVPKAIDVIGNIPTYPLPPLPPISDIIGGGGGGSTGIPAGSTLWTSSAWGNGKSRSISSHHEKDPYDSRLDISAGSGRRGTFPGNGTATLKGDQARFYIYANNYNSAIFMTAKASSGLSNLSLKLRSRHNEGGSGPNRFGGYGVAFHFDGNEVESKREDYHNVHTTIGGCRPGKLNYGQEYNLGMTCQDSGSTVVIGAYINGKRVCQFIDRSPKGYMRDKGLYGRKSYAWIRTNGGGSVTLKNVSLKEIGPLSGSNLAQAYATRRYRLGWGIPQIHYPYPDLEPRITVPY